VPRKLSPRSLLLAIASLAMLVTASTAAAETPGALIAPTSVCPGQSKPSAPVEAQQSAMRCMANFARAQLGLNELAEAEQLDQSADDKAGDILDCDSFSHFACGREFAYWMRQTGYTATDCWRVGENLAWGVGGYGTVRAIFRAWMNSPEHRENLLGDYAQVGTSLRVGTLGGRPGTHVWAQHFGSHC
jgi:uncharacterized protein YkwD